LGAHPDLTSAAALFRTPPITRFAPSPTGYLHLGHIVNAIYVWGVARALGGRVLLRIEDHDRIRSRPSFEAAILEDLEWLGFEPDSGLHPLHRQSEHHRSYQRALERLKVTEHVYACACSRRDIGGERYPGTCRARTIEEMEGHGIRVALDDRPERFRDLLLGPVEQVPAEQCGDLLLKDRDGQWTYQFAVTVDDLLHGVDLVIRGEDLLASTGRQIKLARLLGRDKPPCFLHHPLIVKDGGVKLSKAGGDTGVRELRLAGVPPSDVIGRAAAAAGLLETARSIAASDVVDLFRAA
jgi:glutamyl-tRNA synthetase/glutamyl-Q tRNA(Asp) synthetase